MSYLLNDVAYLGTGVCRQYYSMNNPLIADVIHLCDRLGLFVLLRGEFWYREFIEWSSVKTNGKFETKRLVSCRCNRPNITTSPYGY